MMGGSNYIVCNLCMQSHVPRISRTIHAFLPETRKKRELILSILQNSIFEATDYDLAFTLN